MSGRLTGSVRQNAVAGNIRADTWLIQSIVVVITQEMIAVSLVAVSLENEPWVDSGNQRPIRFLPIHELNRSGGWFRE